MMYACMYVCTLAKCVYQQVGLVGERKTGRCCLKCLLTSCFDNFTRPVILFHNHLRMLL